MKLGSNTISDFKLGSSSVGKIYLGPDQVWPPSVPVTADFYYSVRPISPGYTGDSMAIYDITNGNLNIGFTGGNLDTVSIISHASGSSMKGIKFYNQVGTGKDVSASASSAPFIYRDSQITTGTGGSRPALDFGSASVILTTGGSAWNTAVPRSIFMVVSIAGPGDNYGFLLSSAGYNVYIRKNGASGPLVFNGGSSDIEIHPDYDSLIGKQYLISIFQDVSGNTTTFLNGVAGGTGAAGTTTMTGSSTFGEGDGPNGFDYSDIQLSEFRLYDTDESANRISIESDINNYFNIY